MPNNTSIIHTKPTLSILNDLVSNKSFDKTGFFSLEHLQLLSVSGEDSSSFLQSQLANDILSANTRVAQLQCYCTPQGRCISAMHLLKRSDDHFFLVVPKELTHHLLKRLKMFVFRAKVIIEATDSYHLVGALSDSDQKKNDLLNNDGVYRYTPGRKFYLLNLQQYKDFINDSSYTDEPHYDDNVWRMLDIFDGIPRIVVATQSMFLPQWLNLDLLHGISFKKGCYPGQEIVARVFYRSRVKQRLYIGNSDFHDLHGGDTLFNGNGKKFGVVIDAVGISGSKTAFSFVAQYPIDQTNNFNVYTASSELEVELITPPYNYG